MNNRKLIILLLCVLILPTLIGCVEAYEWGLETVDSAGLVGFYSSIVLDSNDYPCISYFDYSNLNLKYAKWNGISWEIETVDTHGGKYTSLALDVSGYPHISYYDDEVLKYAKFNGTGWEIEVIDTGGGDFNPTNHYTSLALDVSGYPHISYWDCVNKALKYAKWNGTGWEIETVDTSLGTYGGWTSIALDASGYPHISYYDNTNRDLKYAKWNGTGWEIEAVDTTGDVGRCTSIALNASGYPHISYRCDYVDVDNKYYLKYAKWNGISWEIETVDTDGDTGYHTSIALDSSDYPHISHTDIGRWDLKYAKFNGTGWEIEVIDTYGDVGEYTSIALDASGYPHISYYDSTNKALKYAFKGTQISGRVNPVHGTPVVEVKNPKIGARTSTETGEYSTVLKREDNKKYEVIFEPKQIRRKLNSLPLRYLD